MHFYRRADKPMSEWIVVHMPSLYRICRLHPRRIIPSTPIAVTILSLT